MHERLVTSLLNIAEWPVAKTLEFFFNHYSDTIETLFEINMDPAYTQEIVEHALRGDSIYLVPNHQSHTDIIAIGIIIFQIINAIRRQKPDYPDAIIPMAASVLGNKQNAIITIGYQAMTPWFRKHHLNLVPTVTERDATLRGLDASSTTAETKSMIKLMNTGAMMGIFLEGSVTGGRRKKYKGLYTRGRNGIQPKERTLLSYCVIDALVKGKEAVIVPVGISGTYNVLDPDNYRPSPLAISALKHNRQQPDSLIQVANITVGKPILASNLVLPEEITGDIKVYQKKTNPNHKAINYAILGAISEMIPNDERGIFKKGQP